MTTIFYETLPVARLTFEGEWRMDYDAGWEARRTAFPVSLTMPLRSGPVGAAKLLPWLANLLPETHLAEIGQRLKVSPQDIVGLLGHIGRDTAGALSIGEPRKAGVNLQPVPDEQALERILNELPARPFLAGERGVSMSLAGVQEKLPVFVDGDGHISVPVDGTPSTHILKPDTKRLAGSVENEAFCLSLARACGLDAAEATIGVAGQRRYLLVKRYDRFTDPQGEIRRLHQEDLCQLTGHFPSQKYERSSTGRGVTMKMMFDAVSDLVSPGERLKLLDAVIFNVLICNSDSHAKNYSILIGAGGSAKMAPLYDLMCAAVYGQVDQSLPQGISGRFRAPDLRRADWQALADDIGLSGASTLKRVEELAQLVSVACDEVAPHIAGISSDPTRTLERITHNVRKRCRQIQERSGGR
ncbi:type II toxin-antitoxin system HipA family toxin [Agrobacterium radiobacter]|nr:type II toxin-antitoxin system HipA family toxin [Agrobacterium radiobacter]TGE78284.1 type II toxin-antitoxin system HipA family toxin [Rhizobium sp. SEMIA 439]MBB4283633.1 serine/threonine-protein kinase HipA [Agrobacterium radiobacter]MBB4325564.1 serine/threonine-protein kinase HipA [Agrobacterium radiobacter]MBB4458865.1 serine/threonine-protein kinase HipA [Agrobacterium radiobacter]MBB4463238.1 serine/threonine-protein kinase HipA [Agrobacterium radiobacter]